MENRSELTRMRPDCGLVAVRLCVVDRCTCPVHQNVYTKSGIVRQIESCVHICDLVYMTLSDRSGKKKLCSYLRFSVNGIVRQIG